MMQPVYAYDPYNPGSNMVIAPQVVSAPAPVIPAGTIATNVGMPQFAGIQYVMVSDPMVELANCSCVIIRQQPEYLEKIIGCETANRYHVFGINNGYYKYLFKCQERSDFCSRYCLPSHIREFNMEIYHAVNAGLAGNLASKFANMFKPCKCSCCCLNRPEIDVHLGTDNKYVGKIKHLFTCCDPEFNVYNAQGVLKYYVRADCCQCGLLCANNFFGKLSTANFEIYAPGTSNQIASISKMPAQSFGEMTTDADSYKVTFPAGSTAEEKLLLIALGLMIDYQYFETDDSDNNNRRGYRRGYGYGYGLY